MTIAIVLSVCITCIVIVICICKCVEALMDKSTEAYTKVNIPEALEMPEVHPKVQEQLDVIMGKMSSLEMLKGMQRR